MAEHGGTTCDKVWNEPGFCMLESAYERALILELNNAGFTAELHNLTVTLPLKTRLEEVLSDFFIEEDGEKEHGRKVMDFVIFAAITIGMAYGEFREWQKLLSKK